MSNQASVQVAHLPVLWTPERSSPTTSAGDPAPGAYPLGPVAWSWAVSTGISRRPHPSCWDVRPDRGRDGPRSEPLSEPGWRPSSRSRWQVSWQWAVWVPWNGSWYFREPIP